MPKVTRQDLEDDERSEFEILPADNLLVTAKTEDDASQLEIYVYDESQDNLYIHHDIMLPNFPLCLEWLNFPPTSPSSEIQTDAPPPFSNYIAVGTLHPEIEMWSLNTKAPVVSVEENDIWSEELLDSPSSSVPSTVFQRAERR
ncbi:hypothetical protein DFH29DRAFT_1010269 [Suillus ampliporus]|nr:hypothetical protein DFH29DRAFT_1010269 [Suillus ampliporus]